MDGYGLGREDPANAIWSASKPELDYLTAHCPNTSLSASGPDVGLPEGQMGNSEVGHTNIGAGRVVYQDLPRISNAIADGSFFRIPAYTAAMDEARAKGTALHLIGLLSDGGVHSHNRHLYALLRMAKQRGLEKVYIHALLDGRDVCPRTGLGYVRDCLKQCAEIGVGRIATVQGRFYGMDRDKRWERVQQGYDAIVRGKGTYNPDPAEVVGKSYAEDVTDEFVVPAVCDIEGLVRDGDSVIFINFRPDRARELTRALLGQLPEDASMDLEALRLCYVCTTQYDEEIRNVSIAFPPEEIDMPFGEYISTLGLTQLRVAETEKYAHVTFFFNGGREAAFPGEDRVLIPSPKEVPTYDLVPEMSAEAVTNECVKRIVSGKYDVVICNLANCDMVGHTGEREAVIRAVEKVDESVGRIVRAVNSMAGIALITADHGNAEKVAEPDGSPDTAHTTNRVPFILVGASVQLRPGRLCDLAPTMLELMGLQKPLQMTGESLITHGA
jgi:2,3-bisphosphoglycerate-independent phosphoglycerate mutase